MVKEIIIATRFNEKGHDGVHAHFNSFSRYLTSKKIKNKIITPYDYMRPVFLFTFLIKAFVGLINKGWNIRLYFMFRTHFLTKALQRNLKEDENKIIYAQCPFSANAALKARKSSKTKVAMVVHFGFSHSYELISFGFLSAKNVKTISYVDELEKKAFLKCDQIIYVSEFMKKVIEKRIPQTKHISSRVISNPVDAPTSLKKDWMGDIINIGSLVPVKNQVYLIEIMKELRTLGKKYTLSIVGAGTQRSALEKLIVKNNLEETITLLGVVDNAKTLIPQHKIYCHTSKMESQGIVLIEALSYGVPILAPKIGGMVSIVEEGKNGYFIPLNNPKLVANKVIELIEHKKLREKLGSYGKKQFAKKYETGVVCKELLNFLRS